MTSTTAQTLIYTAKVYSPHGGNPRRVAITLPFVSFLADDPHYTAPLPLPEPRLTKYEKPPRWSEKLIRRSLGKDREHTAKLRNQFGYAATVRRIERGGV